jgi:hypothetical protein
MSKALTEIMRDSDKCISRLSTAKKKISALEDIQQKCQKLKTKGKNAE